MPKVLLPVATIAPDQGEYSPPSNGFLKLENIAPSPYGYDKQYAFAPNLAGSSPVRTIRESAGTALTKPTAPYSFCFDVAASGTKVTDRKEFIFCGSGQKLCLNYDGGTYWDDVSAVAYTSTLPEAGGDWQMCRFGDYIMAANGMDTLQIFDMTAYTGTGTANFAAISPPSGSPSIKPKFLATHRNNLFAANIYFSVAFGPFSGVVKDVLMWSDDYNPEAFGGPDETPSVLGAGYIIMRDEFGPITGLASTAETLWVFKEDAIYRVDGPLYTAVRAFTGVGTRYWNTICVIKDVVYFMSKFGPARISGSGLEFLGDGTWARCILNNDNSVPTTTEFSFPYLSIVDAASSILSNIPCAAYDIRTSNIVFGFPSKVRRMRDSTYGGVEEAYSVQRGSLSAAPHSLWTSMCDVLLVVNEKSGFSSFIYPMSLDKAIAGTKNIYGFRGLRSRAKYDGLITAFRTTATYTNSTDYDELAAGTMSSSPFTTTIAGEKIEHFSCTVYNPLVVQVPFLACPADGNLTWRIDSVKPIFSVPHHKRFPFGSTGDLYAIASVRIYNRHGASARSSQQSSISNVSDGILTDGRVSTGNDVYASLKSIELSIYKSGSFALADLSTSFVPWPGRLIGLELEFSIGQKVGLA